MTGRFQFAAEDLPEDTEDQEGAPSEGEDDATEEEEAPDTDTEPTEDAEEPDTALDRTVGAVLSRIEAGTSTPEDAKVIRDLNANWTQNQKVRSELEKSRREFEDMKSEFRELIETEEAKLPDEEEIDLSDIPDEDKVRLQKWADAQGLVKKSDLEQQALEDTRTTIMSESNREGIELFGDDFGTLNPDGTLSVNPEASRVMAPVYDRVSKALTMKDVYTLANFDKLLESQYERGKAEATSARNADNGQRVRRAKKASVTSKVSGGTGDDGLYNREDPKHVGDVRGFFKRAHKILG